MVKMSQVSSETLAWCGGLFDAEGCFSLYWEHNPKSAEYPYLKRTATLEIREELAVDIFQKAFGGNKWKKLSKNKNHSDTFIWRATGRSLLHFTQEISRYLMLKSAQANLILESFDIRDMSSKRITPEEQSQLENCKARMNELNKTGIGKHRKLIPGENKEGFM